MQKEEIQEFINDFLGLTRENTNELKKLIDDSQELDSQLEEFWQIKSGKVVEADAEDIDQIF